MPELPEVECVRLALAQRVVGRRLTDVTVARGDVVRPAGVSRRAPAKPGKPRGKRLQQLKMQLLVGHRVTAVHRLGKQLAIEGDAGCVGIHLGMSGTVTLVAQTEPPEPPEPHTHVVWTIQQNSGQDDTHAAQELRFRDPRRFGGIWVAASFDKLSSSHWSNIGPDALFITPAQLHAGLSRTTRSLKAALLDQQVIAGLGNIYVDEALFRAGLHPQTPSHTVSTNNVQNLVHRVRQVLRAAIRQGGTTLRDYTGLDRQAGAFAQQHRVYGRAGQPCVRCKAVLQSMIIAGRSTTFCPDCQKQDHRKRGDKKSVRK